MNIEIFFWLSKNEVLHRGVRINEGPKMTAEACNFDAAKAEFVELPDAVALLQADEANTCERCFNEPRIYSGYAAGQPVAD